MRYPQALPRVAGDEPKRWKVHLSQMWMQFRSKQQPPHPGVRATPIEPKELPDPTPTPPNHLREPLRPLKNSEARQGNEHVLENNKMKYLRLELKVCEGCGSLWLRRGKADGVYCTACFCKLANFPPTRQIHGGGRPRSRGPVTPRSLSRRCSGGVQ